MATKLKLPTLPKLPPKPDKKGKIYPLFDDERILPLLSLPLEPSNSDDIQGGAFLSLIDAFDRGLDRERFLQIANDTTVLYAYTECFAMVSRIQALQATNQLTPKALDEAIVHVSKCITAVRDRLLPQVQLLVAAAPSGTTIH